MIRYIFLLLIAVSLQGKTKIFNFSDQMILTGDRRWKQIPGEAFLISRDGSSFRLQIEQNPLPLADYIPGLLKGIQRELPKYKLLKQSDITVGGVAGKKMVGELPFKRITLNITTIILPRENRKYLLTLGTRSDRVQEMAPVFKAMLHSIQFKKVFTIKQKPDDYPYLITIPEGFSYRKTQFINRKGDFFYITRERSNVPVDQYLELFKGRLPELFPDYQQLKERGGYLEGMKYHRIQGKFQKGESVVYLDHIIYFQKENKYLLTVVTFKEQGADQELIDLWKTFKGERKE